MYLGDFWELSKAQAGLQEVRGVRLSRKEVECGKAGRGGGGSS